MNFTDCKGNLILRLKHTFSHDLQGAALSRPPWTGPLGLLLQRVTEGTGEGYMGPWGCGRSEHICSFTLLGLEGPVVHMSRFGGGRGWILGLNQSRTWSLRLKVSQAWVLVGWVESYWAWEFSEPLKGPTWVKLQAWLDQGSGSISPRSSQCSPPPGFGFVPSPSAVAPRWPPAATHLAVGIQTVSTLHWSRLAWACLYP